MRDVDILDTRIATLERKLEAAERDLLRVEGFAGAAFALQLTLLRELVKKQALTRERVVQIVQEAIASLRAMYSSRGVNPFDNDRFDFDELVHSWSNAEHERPAEDLLTQLLEALMRGGSSSGRRSGP